MVQKLTQVAVMLFATMMFWVGAAMVDAAIGPDSGVVDFAFVVAFSATVLIWLVALFPYLRLPAVRSATQKAKRTADQDTRLALLLALMTEDERRTLTARLLDESRADGEIVSLADLLAAAETEDRWDA